MGFFNCVVLLKIMFLLEICSAKLPFTLNFSFIFPYWKKTVRQQCVCKRRVDEKTTSGAKLDIVFKLCGVNFYINDVKYDVKSYISFGEIYPFSSVVNGKNIQCQN